MAFTDPSTTERLLNRAVGFLVKLGVGPGYMYILEVPGRKSGKIHGTPVDLMNFQDGDYIVAPRGATQWVRNARAAGSVTLRRGSRRKIYTFTELADADKPVVLAEYLQRYENAVQQFFPVPAGSAAEDFVPLVGRYPVLLLSRA